MALLSLRALAATNSAAAFETTPSRWPISIDCEKE